MIRKRIIDINDIKAYRAIADVPQVRLDQSIFEAQQQDLRPLMNDALYTDFMTRYDVPADPMYSLYQSLLGGQIFLYGGRMIEYPGLIPIVVYYALARFIQSNSINITSFGIVTKKVDQSDPVDPKLIAAEAASLRSQAISYGELLKKFLYINIANYPLYGFKYSASQVNQSGSPFF